MSQESTGPDKTVTSPGHLFTAVDATSITRNIGVLAVVRGVSILFCRGKITAAEGDNEGGHVLPQDRIGPEASLV